MISSSGGEDYYRRKGIFGEKIPPCSSIFATHQGWAECCDYVAVAGSSVSNEIFIEPHALRAGFTIEEIFNLTTVGFGDSIANGARHSCRFNARM
jgi:hypothetical protein